MAPPSPDPLLIGLAAGDEHAFALLCERFGARLLRAAVGMLGRREDAEDAVQEVFVALVQSRRRLAAVEDLTAYLFTTLRNAAARCAARRQRNDRLQDSIGKTSRLSDGCLDHASRCESHDRLQEALEKLPPEQREVVSYRLAGELTFAQIGQALEISTQTAASRYRYALEKLRLLLKEVC
jgi:RNA polymerase sigma-70 factor (ECF subfamily)